MAAVCDIPSACGTQSRQRGLLSPRGVVSASSLVLESEQMQLQPHTLRDEAARRGTDVTDTSPSLLRFGGKASALFEPSRKLCCRGPSRVNAQRHSRLCSPGLYRQLWLGVCQGEQLDPAKPVKSRFSPRRRQPCRWCEAPCCPRSCTGGLALGAWAAGLAHRVCKALW